MNVCAIHREKVENLHFKKISTFVRFWKCLATIPMFFSLNVCAPLKKLTDYTKIFDSEHSCRIWILVRLIKENVSLLRKIFQLNNVVEWRTVITMVYNFFIISLENNHFEKLRYRVNNSKYLHWFLSTRLCVLKNAR